MPKSGPAGNRLPYTTSQIKRAGERIRRAAERGEQPTAEDLQLLNDYRAWHQPTLERCQRELVTLFHKMLDFDPKDFFIAGRPLKTVEAITAKLVRSKTRLSRMQDIARSGRKHGMSYFVIIFESKSSSRLTDCRALRRRR